MFLALAFGLFLTAPLLILVASVVRTAIGVSRGEDAAAPVPASEASNTPTPIITPAPAVTREVAAPTAAPAPRFGRRTRAAVAGGQRRDFFGDAVVAKRPVTTPAPDDVLAAPTVTHSATPAPAPAMTVEEDGPQGTLLEFPMREAQLERLRQQYAGRA